MGRGMFSQHKYEQLLHRNNLIVYSLMGAAAAGALWYAVSVHAF